MSTGEFTDAGLLSPVRVGAPSEGALTEAAWLQAMLDAEAALARAQARLGLVPEAAAATITRTARADRFDLTDLANRGRSAANPIVAMVRALTQAVAATDPAAAEYVHQGSTSQDILDTAMMLVAARTLRLIEVDVDRTAVALAGLAERHRDTLMAGRTLTQHAVPTTFGLKAAGWLQGVLDAELRLRRLLAHGLPVQLGGAAGTMAGYVEYARAPGSPIDPHEYPGKLITAFADELSLAEPVAPWHTARAPLADLAGGLSTLTGALGKLAVDVQSLSRSEVAEVAEPAEAGRGVSSAMPQKRNPVLATLIRSAALQVPAIATVLMQSMLAEDERPAGVWHAEWQPLRDCLRLAGGAAHTAAELAEGLVASPTKMRANLDLTQGLIVAERVAVVLAARLGKTAARDLVTRLSARAATEERPLADLLAAAPELADVTSHELSELVDPANYTGAAGVLVDRVLDHFRSRDLRYGSVGAEP
ncbi:MAG: nitrosuccinate lyase [Micromonosporaceae bacterium]|nr:nitrosuccinate lyase [Micromonosporaceae bacterium]